MATMGRPTEYKESFVQDVKDYIASCVDTVEEFNDSLKPVVNLPTIEGCALYLHISKNTIYEWEKIYPDFSDVIGELRHAQASRLVNKGLSGAYNPTIAKVLLTKHGYREGIDQTTDDKPIPTPILNVFSDHSHKKGIQPEETN